MEITNIGQRHGVTFEYFVFDNLGRGIFANNVEFEPHINTFVRMYAKRNELQNVIDVGANFGYHTLSFSREVKGQVFAFEPQSQNFWLLERNVRIHNNAQNIVIFNAACGNEQGEVMMSALNEVSEMQNMGDFTPNIQHPSKSADYTIVPMITLDSMQFPRVDLIKIDVQGWEKNVLTGAIQLLRRDKPVFIVEFEDFQLAKMGINSEILFDFIRSNDYYIFYLEHDYPCDHVCVHNDRLAEFRLQFRDVIFNHTEDNELNHNYSRGVTEKISFTLVSIEE